MSHNSITKAKLIEAITISRSVGFYKGKKCISPFVGNIMNM